jgi:hypothetical protein
MRLEDNSMELEPISRGILTQSQIFIADEMDREVERGGLDYHEVETMLLQLVLQISNMWEQGIYPFLINPSDVIRKGEAFLIRSAQCGNKCRKRRSYILSHRYAGGREGNNPRQTHDCISHWNAVTM